MTFEQVFTIFKDYMEQDKELEVVKTKKGYLRIIWSGGLPYCEDGYLCRTPEELFGNPDERVREFIGKFQA